MSTVKPAHATAVLAAAAVLVASPAGHAQDATIVIVSLVPCCSEQAFPEAEDLVAKELQALDFQVLVVPAQATQEAARREELVAIAGSAASVGAVQIVRVAGGVELWVVDNVTAKTSIRSLDMGDVDASIVALRAVELFRASLLEIHVTPAPPEPVPPPVVELAATPVPDRPAGPVGLRMGPGILGSPGGTGVHGTIAWAASWLAIPHLAVELAGTVTFAGQEIRSGQSASTFGAATLGAWILWSVLSHGVVRPSVGLGGGLLAAWSRGLTASDGIVSRDRVLAGHLGVTAQLALALSRNVWLRLGATVTIVLPMLRILFADHVAARFGMPLVEGWAAVEVRIG